MEQTRHYFYAVFDEKEWKNFPPDIWDYGDNNHLTRYDNIRGAKEGDIILCSYKKEIIAIGEVCNFDEAHDDYTYFKVIMKPETIKPFSLTDIKNKTTIEIRSYGKHVKLKAKQIRVAQWIQQCYEQDREIPFEVNREDEMSDSNTCQNMPLNQILYGPPGTGKTYQTIDRALDILLEFREIESIPENREERRKIFDNFKEEEQIEFVTFHQNYSYEEFVEGIKPVLNDNDKESEEKQSNTNNSQSNTNNSQNVTYEIRDGIFKKICGKARNNLNISQQQLGDMQKNISIDYKKTLWRIYTIPDRTPKSDYFKECYENGYIWIYQEDAREDFKDNIIGDYLIIPTANVGRSQRIRAFGVFGDFMKEEGGKLYRKVEWLWEDVSQEGVFIPEANFARNTFQRVNKAKSEILQSIEKILKPEKEKLKPYIFIIDEINRGNISKILGELITLIEPSKRIGNDEELKVTLPYSNDEFSVPKNLYLIGTMNTADRSIALLDTALRRRFEFIEMMPDSTHLHENVEGVELRQLLDTMNKRIEFLLDREHTIGHSFFIGIESVSELKEVFAKKIIPLLQEYFYEDYAKIDAVLNSNGMIKSKNMQDLNISLSDEFVESDKKIYKITDSNDWKVKHFQKIYDNTITL